MVSKYIRGFPGSARVDLLSAMEALYTDRVEPRLGSGVPPALETVLGTLDEGTCRAHLRTYFEAANLIEVTDIEMHRLSDVALADPRWGKVRDQLTAIEGLIGSLRAAR